MRTAESVVFTLWPPGPEERKTSIFRSFGSIVDLLGLVDLGEDEHADGGGVDAALRLGLRHALHAVHAALVLEVRPDALGGVVRGALHRDLDVLVPAEVALGALEQLGLPALRLGVVEVHPQQVGREQRRLLAALPRLDLEDHVAPVVGVARDQQAAEAVRRRRLGDLEVGDLGGERRVLGRELARGGEVVAVLPVRVPGADDLAELGVPPADLAGTAGIGVQLRVRQLPLEVRVLRDERGDGGEPVVLAVISRSAATSASGRGTRRSSGCRAACSPRRRAPPAACGSRSRAAAAR